MLLLGLLAFAVMALGDINDAAAGVRAGKLLFPLGVGMLWLSVMISAFAAGVELSARVIVWLCAAAVFAAATFYCLFMALPFSTTYVQGGKKQVCAGGAYALCRHPALPPFIAVLVSLAFSGLLPVLNAVLFGAADVLYSLFQDQFIFPRTLGGYAEYRAATPFVFPNKKSAAAFSSARHKKG